MKCWWHFWDCKFWSTKCLLGFLRWKLTLQMRKIIHALTWGREPCKPSLGLLEREMGSLSWLCISFCDRTPKQKAQEEPDRDARPGGAQAEMSEGEDKVKTDSYCLSLTNPCVPSWLGEMSWVGAVRWNPALPALGWFWAGDLPLLVGVGSCCCMLAPDM